MVDYILNILNEPDIMNGLILFAITAVLSGLWFVLKGTIRRLFIKYILELFWLSIRKNSQERKAIGNNLITALRSSAFYTKNPNFPKEYIYKEADFSSYHNMGVNVILSELLYLKAKRETVNTESLAKSRGSLIADLNYKFPKTYRELLKLFDRGYANEYEIDKLF